MNEKGLYNKYYVGLKSALNDLYGVVVTSDSSQHETLPIIEMNSIGINLRDETLDKSEKKFAFSYEINIYAKDKAEATVDDIIFDLSDGVVTYFLDEGFDIVSNLRVPNIDKEVRRKNIRVSGVYDTNREVIYRK
jgi:hypothetical protein